ncbi:von Willebrand factor A domain-containing protein 7-like isoform X1 [Argonauta hians]
MMPQFPAASRVFKGFPPGCSSLTLSLLVIIQCMLTPSQGFLHNRISYEDYLLDDDLTHQDITEIGVTRAAGFYLGASKDSLPDINSTDPRSWFENNFKRVANPDNFWNAIQDIVKHRELYNRRWKSDALKNMNGERINEGSLELLILKNTLLASLKYASVYSSLRVYVAQALHILQSFYSNTNWVEMHGDAVSEDLGMGDREFYVADPYQDTCRNCSISGSCRDNLIVTNVLTSGYRSGQDTRKPRWNRPVYWNGKKINVQKNPSEGKCSHGGLYDNSRIETPSGGINKDSSNPVLSPHHYLHRAAAWAAIKATELFFTHEKHGIFKNMTHKQIQGLFNIRLTRGSLVFVIDVTDSMRQEIDAVKDKTVQIVEKTKGKRNAPTSFILSTFSDPERMTEVKQTNDANEMIQWLRNLEVASGGDCEEYALSGLEQAIERATPESQVYLFTDAPPKEPSKFESVLTKAIKKRIRITPILSGGCGSRRRGKRDTSDDFNFDKLNSWYKIFDQLADKTGSQVYVTNEKQLENTLTVLEENLVEYPVEVTRSILDPVSRTALDIYVDDNLWDLRIKIESHGNDFSVRLLNPGGRDVLESSNNHLIKLTDTVYVIKFERPRPGMWRLERTTEGEKAKRWLVKVTAQSDIDFSVNLYDNEDGVKFEISGRPIAGTKITAQVRIQKIKQIEKVDNIILFDSSGNTLLEAKLKQGKHRRNKSFKGKFVIPKQTFYIGISGTDKRGHRFTRMRFIPYIPSVMKLEVTPIPVISYPKMVVPVKFLVSNEGLKTERVVVFISEALDYTVRNPKQWFDLVPGQNVTGRFTVTMRDNIGKNVVLTITSEIEGGIRRTSTQYDTVETTILEKREIIKPPVRQNPPTCNFEIPVSSTDECIRSYTNSSCCRHRWTAVINAEASSDFSPIVNMISSMSSTITSDRNISHGVVSFKANISNDCCTDRDTVYIRDTKNQIGKCFLRVVPSFMSFNTTCKPLPPKKVPLECNLYVESNNTMRCAASHKELNCCRHQWSAVLKVKNGSNPAPIVSIMTLGASVIITNENSTDTSFIYEAEVRNDCCVVTETISVTDAKNQTGNCSVTVVPQSMYFNSTCKPVETVYQRSSSNQLTQVYNSVTITTSLLLILICYHL